MLKKSVLLALLALLGATPGHAQKVKVKTKKGQPEPATIVLPTPEPATRQAPVEADWNQHYAAFVTPDRLREYLQVLASDKLEGRETGEPGQHMAAEYIAGQFAASGLQGALEGKPNPYLQVFQLEHVTWAADPSLQVGSTRYRWLVDFYGLGGAGFDQQTEIRPVFAGYGIEQDGYSDYKGLSVNNKDVIILLGEPTKADGSPRFGTDGNPSRWGADHRLKAAVAMRKGARSVFFVNFNPNSNFSKLAARLAPTIARPDIQMAGEKNERVPMFFISPAVGYKVLGTSAAAVEKYVAGINATGLPVPSPFKPGKFSIKAPREHKPFTTENVLGFVPGSEVREEIVVISAHHDHLGVREGKVYNGADDDGSGTAALLNMAEAFARAKREGHGPRRSLLFLSVTGEEEGLYGSDYYTAHPVYPLANTVADLNVDMIGRTDPEHEGKNEYLYVIGSDKLASQLKNITEQQNEQYTKLELDYRFDDPADPDRFYYRSDHYNFAVHKVPVAFFFNGVHADYHQETDEIEKIEFDKMAKRAQLVFHVAWELVNRDQRIPVDSNKP